MVMEYVVLAVIGLASGIVGALVGLGGGIILSTSNTIHRYQLRNDWWNYTAKCRRTIRGHDDFYRSFVRHYLI